MSINRTQSVNDQFESTRPNRMIPRPVFYKTEAEGKTITVRPRPRPSPKELSRDFNIRAFDQ